MLIVAHRTNAEESRDYPVDICWRDDWRYTFDVRDKRSPSWLITFVVGGFSVHFGCRLGISCHSADRFLRSENVNISHWNNLLVVSNMFSQSAEEYLIRPFLSKG